MLGLKSSTWTYICVCVHVYPHAHTHTNHTHTGTKGSFILSFQEPSLCHRVAKRREEIQRSLRTIKVKADCLGNIKTLL